MRLFFNALIVFQVLKAIAAINKRSQVMALGSISFDAIVIKIEAEAIPNKAPPKARGEIQFAVDSY